MSKGILCAVLVYALQIATASEPRLTIKVSNPIVMKGGAIRVVCTVPRAAGNRGVTALIENYRAMFDQLDGAQSRITHPFLFERLGCDVGDAVCILETQGEKDLKVRQTIQVAGCEPHE